MWTTNCPKYQIIEKIQILWTLFCLERNGSCLLQRRRRTALCRPNLWEHRVSNTMPTIRCNYRFEGIDIWPKVTNYLLIKMLRLLSLVTDSFECANAVHTGRDSLRFSNCQHFILDNTRVSSFAPMTQINGRHWITWNSWVSIFKQIFKMWFNIEYIFLQKRVW